MHESGIHIALNSDKLFTLFGIPITNTLISAWFSIIVLLTVAFFLRNKIKEVPGRLQALVESLFEYVLDYMEEVLGDKRLSRRLFPIIMTIFLFVLVSNWAEHLPFFETLRIHTHAGDFAFIKSANTDLNTTLALAIISFFVVEILGI